MDYEVIVSVLIAVITALIAWWENYKKKEVISFYSDPVMVPDAVNKKLVAELPPRSFLMSSSTLHWLTFDATPENKKLIVDQVKEAEMQGLTKYRINFIGGYYDIEWGLQYGGSGNPGGK